MTVYAVVTCDGTRNGLPCRGAFTLPQATTTTDATDRATQAGWRLGTDDQTTVYCPAPGHDQDPDDG